MYKRQILLYCALLIPFTDVFVAYNYISQLAVPEYILGPVSYTHLLNELGDHGVVVAHVGVGVIVGILCACTDNDILTLGVLRHLSQQLIGVLHLTDQQCVGRDKRGDVYKRQA